VAGPWIDTHAHLDDERFRVDLPDVLERAKLAGLTRVLAVATTAPSSHACVQLAEANAMLRPSVGLHPNHVAEAEAGDWDEILALARNPRVVALGETGLDRHWNYTPFPQQEEFFARHLALSRGLKLPVIIHCREADDDVQRMLRDDFDRHGAICAVLHSFSGDATFARACLQMGLFISFAGMLTYKSATALREVAATIPLDRLLVETDCPYLSPVPMRGQRNEPAHVVHTATCLAECLGVASGVLAEQTTKNAHALFNFD
jgi:TatD DNase family protein